MAPLMTERHFTRSKGNLYVKSVQEVAFLENPLSYGSETNREASTIKTLIALSINQFAVKNILCNSRTMDAPKVARTEHINNVVA